MMIIRWMCEVTLRDRRWNEELRRRLGIVSVCEKVCQERLWWFGHVERKDEGDWVSVNKIWGKEEEEEKEKHGRNA